MLNRELAIAIIGDGGHDGVGRGAVGDTVVGIDLDLAQRVGVLAGLGVGNLVHRDLAVGRIGAPGDDLVTLDELEGELAVLEIAAGQGLGRDDLVGDAGLVRGCIVLVLKVCRLGALERMDHLKRAVAVVDDARLDGVARLIVRDPVAQPRFVGELLAQLVGVSAGLIVSDFVHDDLAVGIVLAGGDDIVTLDELEGELAVLEVAPVQGLGRDDLVGDARALGGQAVRILELSRLFTLQDMMDIECAIAIVRNRGHDGVGRAVVGDAIALGSTVDLAQRVSVLAGLGVPDGAHRNHAVVTVLASGDDLVALNELEGELAGLEVAAGQGLVRSDLVGDAGVLRRQVVGILKLNPLAVIGVLQLMRSHQLTLAVVGNGGHDGVDGFVVGDAAGIALDLTQRIGVLASLGVLDGTEHNVAVGVILDGLDKLRVLALDLAQLKAKLAVLEIAPCQDLGNLDLAGDAGLNGICSVGVLEHLLARGHLHLSAEHALLVGRYRHGNLRNILAVSDAIDSLTSVLLADLVDIRAGLGVGDLTEVNSRVAHGRSRSRSRRHRGVVLGRQPKLKRVLIRPFATLEHLGQTKAGLGIHRRRRHVVRKADLAVVAQVRINLRCALLG